MKAAIYVLLLVTSPAFAQRLVVTEQPSTYELRDAESRVISRGHASCAVAFAAAPGPGRYLCLARATADIVGVCDPLPPPPPVVVGGFTILGDFASHACPNDHLSFTQTQLVRDPYPSCAWVERPVPITDCDGRILNPPVDDGASTAQTDPTRSPWLEGTDYPLGDPCPAEANGNCHPYPNTPREPPAGCGSEFCVTPG